MSINEKKIQVVQSKDLNDAKYERAYTMLEKKLISKLVSTINPYDDKTFELQEIPVSELEFFGDKSKNHTYIHSVCKSLIKNLVLIDGLEHVWFTKIGCKNGVVYYKFSEDMRGHLIEIDTKYNEFYLDNILNLKKYHSMRVYEIISLMVRWKNKQQIFNRRMNWEDFKGYLNVKPSYRNHKIVADIIEKVQEEIEEKTDLKFNFSINKDGGTYNHIDFVIIKNKK